MRTGHLEAMILAFLRTGSSHTLDPATDLDRLVEACAAQQANPNRRNLRTTLQRAIRALERRGLLYHVWFVEVETPAGDGPPNYVATPLDSGVSFGIYNARMIRVESRLKYLLDESMV